MRKLKLFTLFFALAASIGMSYALEPLEGDTWDNNTKTLMVNSNTGNSAYASQTEIKHLIVSDAVTELGWGTFFFDSLMTTVELGKNLETIGISAFNECRSLSTITVPASVTNIGVRAFRNCTSLTTFTCEAVTPPTIGNAIFENANNLTAIYVPAASVDAYKSAWSDYASLIEAIGGGSTPANVCGDGLTWELSEGVLTISYDGEGTGEMTDFGYENDQNPVNVAPWKENKSEITTVIVGDGVKSIGNYAFNDLSENFTAVTIANGVERIGVFAFTNSEEITEITLPSSLKTIDDQGFANCGFTSITIPSGVTSIGYRAFSWCRNLTSLTCEATTPPTLASGVFYKISNTSSIPLYVPSESVAAYTAANQWNAFDVQAITGGGSTPANSCGDGLTWELNNGELTISYTGTGTGVMDNYASLSDAPWYSHKDDITSVTITDGVKSVGSYSFGYYENLVTVTIGNDVETIGEYAFGDCYKFTTLNLGNSVKHIGNRAFMWAKVLTGFTLPSTLETIGERAFLQNKLITSLTIPSNVTSIGPSAFMYCAALTSVTVEATTPPTLGATVFEGVPTSSIPLHVPSGSVAAYTAADQWNAFDIQDPTPAYETVMNLINEIPDPVVLTAECKAKIDEARTAFDALSDGDKDLVTNSATLTTAEAAFENVMNIWLSGDCDVILWKDTTLTVQKHAGEGNGAMADYNYASRAPWYSSHWYDPKPNDIVIKSVTIEEGVTHLGDYAFAWMSEMKTATIPSSVTTIPKDAFYWSKAVDDIYLHTNPSDLMWTQPNTADVQFKPNKGTNCHVPIDLLPYYQEWLNTLNVTYVGDQTPTVPTIEVGKVFNDSDEVYIGPDTTYIQFNCFASGRYFFGKGTFKIIGTEYVKGEVFGMKFEPKSLSYCFMKYYSNGKTSVSFGTNCCTTAIPTQMTVVSGDGTKDNPFVIEPNTKGECVQAEWTTLPQAVSEITYDGEPHTLVAAGVSNYGTVQYSLDNGASWSADLPQGTDPVTYTVHYRVIGGNSCILGIDYDPNNKVTASIVAPAVENVEAKIAAVPSPVVYTPACEAAIADARSAYDALDDALKPFVENYAVLTAAEATYDNMKYVSAVEAKINEIPSPMTAENTKLSVYQKVQDARAAYDALTADQQALVSNYSRLTDAEDAFAAIGGGGDAPAGALSGKLSIDESSVVYFSKGNLQATTADLGANWAWGFAANQWDLIGDAAANNAISGNGEVSENGTVDLFGWSTSATKYGIHNGTNKNISDYAGDFADWGATMGDGWFTLSKEQWEYLLNTRTGDKAATVNSVADCRYTKATINTDGTAVKGIILFPDGGTFAESEFTEVGSPNTENANYTTTCTTAQWTALQAKGCVFLPAAGRRYGAEVSNEDPKGYYWSSSPKPSTDDAYFVFFYPYNVVPASNDFRCMGLSVRLVTEASASPLAAAQVVKDLIDAIGEVSYPGSKEAIKAAREAVDALGANASLLENADLQKLTDAETAYAQLLEQAVAAVKDQIDALPATPLTDATKKLSEYNKVTDAREAYDALSDEEKAAVSNYGKLEAAEAAFAAISGGTKPVDIVWDGNTGIANVSPTTTSPAYEGMTVTVGKGSSFSTYQSRLYFTFNSQPNGGFIFANENGTNITKVVIESTSALTSTMTEVDRMGSGWVISNENKTATWIGNADSVSIWKDQHFANYWVVDSIVFTVNGTASPLADAQAAKDLIDAIPSPVVLSDECNAAIQAARDAVTALGENASLLDDADIDKLAKAEADFALLIKDATAVVDKIDAIGEVTFSADSKGKIVDAREAYDALDDELKPYVSNLDKLTAAEAAYEAARPFATVTTVPAAVEALQYTGAAQTLITAGAAEHGTVLYSLDGENYSTELPTALLPGAYTIYYKVQATDDYKDVAPVTVIATIAYNYPATYGLFGIPEGWSVKVNDEEVAVVNGAVKNIAANDRFDIMPVKPEDVKRVEIVPYLLDLATVTDSVIYILDGDSITGTANGHITVVIVPDAKVYFKDVNLTNTGSHPAVLCGGNAEMVVVGENNITCTTEGEYGIRAAGAGTTLTISGDKTLLKATIDPNGGTVNQ